MDAPTPRPGGAPPAGRCSKALLPIAVVAAALVLLTGAGAAATGSSPSALERSDGAATQAVLRSVGGAQLSVRLPVGAGPHPVVVHVPGGGWTGLAPTPFAELGYDQALAEGWAVATVRYEPASGADGTTAVHQADAITAALRWLRERGSTIGIAGPVVGVGHSAGAHLLGLASARAPDAAQPDSLLLVSGVYDLAEDVRSAPMLADGLRAAAGCSAACTVGDRFSPSRWADPADPPVVVVHGTDDQVTPPGTSARYVDALLDAGVPAVLRLVPGAAHHDDVLARAVVDALREIRGAHAAATSSKR